MKEGEKGKSVQINGLCKLKTGDFVVFKNVEGMDKVNGKIPRPIKILNNKQFSIEETKIFPKPGFGGIMEIANVPYEICF